MDPQAGCSERRKLSMVTIEKEYVFGVRKGAVAPTFAREGAQVFLSAARTGGMAYVYTVCSIAGTVIC